MEASITVKVLNEKIPFRFQIFKNNSLERQSYPFYSPFEELCIIYVSDNASRYGVNMLKYDSTKDDTLKRVLRSWALGTTYSTVFQKDFCLLYQTFNITPFDFAEFELSLYRNFAIEVKEAVFTF